MTEGSRSNLRAASGARDPRVARGKERLGRVIGDRWTLRELIGVGGSATVYAATHRNGRRVALKVLHPELADHPTIRKRFLSEGYAANKVEHDGAVHVLDDGADGGLVFLVMELLVGRSLAERLDEEGPMEVADVVSVAAALLLVLAAAHDRGVVHRDIKPSNVFQTATGGLKVLDFGVARIRDSSEAPVTQSGYTVGTPAFMAPEQAAGRLDEVSALTDVWAVGATMFQLLTGRLVHVAEGSNAAIVAAATKPAIAVRQLKPSIPEDVAAVIDRALSFRPEDRFPNARAMRSALTSTTAGGTIAASPGGDTLTVPEAFSGPRLLEPRRDALRVVVALSLLAGIGYLLFHARQVSEARRPHDSVASSVPAVTSALPSVALANSTPRPRESAPAAPAPASEPRQAGTGDALSRKPMKPIERPGTSTTEAATKRRDLSEDELMDRRK